MRRRFALWTVAALLAGFVESRAQAPGVKGEAGMDAQAALDWYRRLVPDRSVKNVEHSKQPLGPAELAALLGPDVDWSAEAPRVVGSLTYAGATAPLRHVYTHWKPSGGRGGSYDSMDVLLSSEPLSAGALKDWNESGDVVLWLAGDSPDGLVGAGVTLHALLLKVDLGLPSVDVLAWHGEERGPLFGEATLLRVSDGAIAGLVALPWDPRLALLDRPRQEVVVRFTAPYQKKLPAGAVPQPGDLDVDPDQPWLRQLGASRPVTFLAKDAALERFQLRQRLMSYRVRNDPDFLEDQPRFRRMCVFDGPTRIEGDLRLDWADGVPCAGVIVDGDLEVAGSILNFNSNDGPFLLVLGKTTVRSLASGGAEHRFLGNVTAQELVIGHYNDGSLKIDGDLTAGLLYNDDHHVDIGGAVQAPTWDWRGGLGEEEAGSVPRLAELLHPQIAVQPADEDGPERADLDELFRRLRSGEPILRAAPRRDETPPR